MTITQTVDISADHRITLEVPHEVPVGKTQVVIQFPARNETTQGEDNEIPPEAKGQMSNEAFRQGLRRAYGAWKDNPWTNHIEDIRAMRDEWGHRDPWNPDPAKRHRD